MSVGVHPPPPSVALLTAELREIETEVGRVRTAIARDARMNRDDKVYLYARLKRVDAIAKKYLQLSLLTPDQRTLR